MKARVALRLALAAMAALSVVVLVGRESTGPVPGEPPSVVLDPKHMRWSFAALVGRGDGGRPRSYALQVGTLGADEILASVEVPFVVPGDQFGRQPAVSAPVGGQVLYVADDGARSAIARLRVAVGARPEPVLELPQVVWDLAIDPGGTAAYLALVERDGRDAGVFRLMLDGSGELKRVLPAAEVGQASKVRLAAVMSFNVSLRMALDGGHVVRVACAAGGCVTEILDLLGGNVAVSQRGSVIGVVGGTVYRHDCGPGPCGIEAVDLRTDETRQIVATDHEGFLTTVGGRPMLVIEGRTDRDGNPLALQAIDVGTGEGFEILAAERGGGVGILPLVDMGNAMIAIQPGIVLAAQRTAEGIRVFAIALDSRERLEVRRPPIAPPMDGFNG